MPSPSVQKAILTPSAVLAYWMHGSIGGLRVASIAFADRTILYEAGEDVNAGVA